MVYLKKYLKEKSKTMILEKAFEYIDSNEGRYLNFLKEICSFEAQAKDKNTINDMMTFVEEFSRQEGFCVTRIPMDYCGDYLMIEINENAEKACTLHAHMDTVHEKGIFGQPAVKESDGKLYGPGVIDCKGGAAMAMFVLKSLKEAGYKKHIRLLLNTDEEVTSFGRPEGSEIIAKSAEGFKCSLNCEAGREGQLVVRRAGVTQLKIHIKGRGGHSGVVYFESSSAIVEAAHKIIEIESHSKKDKVTFNCGIISGGTVVNAVPDSCTIGVDIRVRNMEDMQKSIDLVNSVAQKSFVPGTSATVKIDISRPPMIDNEDTMALFDKFSRLNKELGFGELSPSETGGGSDASYTQMAGVPTICTLGPCGKFLHSKDEYMDIKSFKERAKLVAAFISEI